MRLNRLLGLTLTAATAVAALGYGVAAAQYPQPLGVCTVTPASANVQTNGTASFTVKTTLGDGSPAPAVPGTVAVSSQPGTGAGPVTPTYTTNSQGTATITINTGTSAGTVNVLVTAGTLSCASAVSVVAPRVNPDVIKPPATGTGTDGSNDGMNYALIALAGLGVAAMGAGTLVAVRRR
ncbi:MAG: hypothetical protein HYX53_14785 [Chloroflexi bacterium]|nr:hypothetical protein [Chloroflexota bacterium]